MYLLTPESAAGVAVPQPRVLLRGHAGALLLAAAVVVVVVVGRGHHRPRPRGRGRRRPGALLRAVAQPRVQPVTVLQFGKRWRYVYLEMVQWFRNKRCCVQML